MNCGGEFYTTRILSVRTAAQQRLAELYRQAGDGEALERLAAATLLTDPTVERLAKLAEAAADNGQWATVLLASLATPPEQRSAELLLQAAFQLGWWQSFQRTLAELPGREAAKLLVRDVDDSAR